MSLQKSYLLGMDLGTTNIKGNLMDEDGNLISTAGPDGMVGQCM